MTIGQTAHRAMSGGRQSDAVQFDDAAAKEFAGRFLGVLDDAAIAILTSVGHQTGLFDTLAELPAASEQIADAAGLTNAMCGSGLAA